MSRLDNWSLADYIDLEPETKGWLKSQSTETQLFIIKELKKTCIFRKIRIILHAIKSL